MEATGDPYAIVLGVLGGLLPVIGAMIAVTQWLNSRFSQLDRRMALMEQQAENTEDKITLLSNGIRESVSHARDRFFAEISRLDKDLGGEVEEIRNFLQKENGFIVRASRKRDD